MDSFFKIREQGTTIKRELYAGLTTFLTMSYIVLTNPRILSEAGMPFAALVSATVLVAIVGSVLMGLFANLPISIAPGMGLNAFFAYNLVSAGILDWQNALGVVLVSGVIFLVLSVFRVRELIVRAIPLHLRYGISGGIGFFIAFIGLQWADFVTPHPATLVTFGGLSPKTILFVIGLSFTSLLVIKRVKAASIYGILFTSLLAIGFDKIIPSLKEAPLITFPESIVSLPDFSLFGALRFDQVFSFGAIIPIFVFVFVDFFDSLSTFFGVAEVGNFVNPKTGEPKNLKRAFFADAFTTVFSGVCGSSPGTAYIESAAGIREGGKTGLTAISSGLLFIPFFFLSPLLGMIPSVAVAPVLVLVGTYMMVPLRKIDWYSLEIALPAFLSLVFMPLTYSLSVGISWGILSYTIIKLLLGRWKDISPTLWFINVFVILALLQL